jgi:4-alpha-glucanotransferase
MRESEAADRDRDRPRLLALLQQLGLLTAAAAALLLPEPGQPVFDPALTVAIHRFLQRTPCALVLYQAEDLLGSAEMVNLPGTIDEHPNWRRRLGVPVASLLGALETMI